MTWLASPYDDPELCAAFQPAFGRGEIPSLIVDEALEPDTAQTLRTLRTSEVQKMQKLGTCRRRQSHDAGHVVALGTWFPMNGGDAHHDVRTGANALTTGSAANSVPTSCPHGVSALRLLLPSYLYIYSIRIGRGDG